MRLSINLNKQNLFKPMIQPQKLLKVPKMT